MIMELKTGSRIAILVDLAVVNWAQENGVSEAASTDLHKIQRQSLQLTVVDVAVQDWFSKKFPRLYCFLLPD